MLLKAKVNAKDYTQYVDTSYKTTCNIIDGIIDFNKQLDKIKTLDMVLIKTTNGNDLVTVVSLGPSLVARTTIPSATHVEVVVFKISIGSMIRRIISLSN